MPSQPSLLERFYASSFSYNIYLFIWTNAVKTFFREIRPRGTANIPRSGPVIFVAAPHHNQAWRPLRSTSDAYRLSSA